MIVSIFLVISQHFEDHKQFSIMSKFPTSQCFEMLESTCNTSHNRINVMSLHSHTTTFVPSYLLNEKPKMHLLEELVL
jgi:hypothetical protein